MYAARQQSGQYKYMGHITFAMQPWVGAYAPARPLSIYHIVLTQIYMR
jgi:hypothetical protein